MANEAKRGSPMRTLSPLRNHAPLGLEPFECARGPEDVEGSQRLEFLRGSLNSSQVRMVLRGLSLFFFPSPQHILIEEGIFQADGINDAVDEQ
jgi:hypothetical protein